MPASRKLQAGDARQLLSGAKKLIAMKGRKVSEFELDGKPDDEAVTAMLGPTGNLRAPTIRVGKTYLVGFNDDIFEKMFN